MSKHTEPLLWLDDHRGIYIPRDFAQSFIDRAKNVEGVDAEQWAILEDPDHEHYWEVWIEVLDTARVINNDGARFTLYQDGALWLIPEGMSWSDEDEFFVWPDDAEEQE